MTLSIFQKIKERILAPFSPHTFDAEWESTLWEKAALLYLNTDKLGYGDIIEWMDRIYDAPLHIIYKKIDNNYLLLENHQVIPTNLIKQTASDSNNQNDRQHFVSIYSAGRSLDNVSQSAASEITTALGDGTNANSSIRNFNERIKNLPKKIRYQKEFENYGQFDLTVGVVDHFPLRDQEGNFWGVYAVGPDCDLTEALANKTDLISSHLSHWIIKSKDSKSNTEEYYLNQWDKEFGPIGVGQFNLRRTSAFFLRYLTNAKDLEGAALFEIGEKRTKEIASFNLNKETIAEVITSIDKNLIATDDSATIERQLAKLFEIPIIKQSSIFPFYVEDSIVFLFIPSSENKESDISNIDEPNLQMVLSAFVDMLNFRPAYFQISDSIVDIYFELQKAYEQHKSKTQYHTQRAVALAKIFGEAFGLNDNENDKLLQTVKLHDIGLMGAWIWSKKTTISDVIEHPLIGKKMVENLPIDKIIKDGIATHHERIDGKGTPEGVIGENIPWTGKIMGMIEFIVEFIEEHQHSTSEDNLDEQLSEQLINRSESQFDMMLVPTMLEIIQDNGWEKLCLLGTKEV